MNAKNKIKFILLPIGSLGLCLLLYCGNMEKGKRYLNSIQHKSSEPLSLSETDTNEYPAGFPEIKINAVRQILKFPLPRFQEGHQLHRNFLWMDPNFIGGEKKGSKSLSIKNSCVIQFELASKWNYYLQISPNTSCDYANYGHKGSLLNSWINLANEHPELPTSAISFWIQMRGNHVTTQKLSDNCYLRDEQNHFITDVMDNNGVHRGGKLFSPTIPLDTIALDGIAQRHFLETLFLYLKRPLDIINEEDEIFTVYDSTTLMKDPSLVADKNKMNIGNWDLYQAEKRKQIEITYRDAFMTMPQLKNTIYSVYAIDGHTHYRNNYSVMRKINTPIKGQYYSTPDFYPRYPWNWRNWNGPWHGLSWIFESRPNELAAGDSLFSPFVAAGWDNDPTKNICPAQWLGLLKLLAMSGAEFYYTGFFNEHQPFADPATYIWQAVMPAYAQAVTSRYENIFRHGEIINLPEFVIPSGDNRIIVLAKKIKGKKIYAITGTIQNSSNKKNATPLKAIAEIKLDGVKMKFEVRRQGSTYIFNNEDPLHPVFYQLDGWHEASHPSRWNCDFIFEAELFDNTGNSGSIKTEIPADASANNFTNFTSYVSFAGNGSMPEGLKYFFTPRDSSSSYSLELNARSKGAKTGFRILLDEKELCTIKNISENKWKPYTIQPDNASVSLIHLNNQAHAIIIIPLNADAEIDKFQLKRINIIK